MKQVKKCDCCEPQAHDVMIYTSDKTKWDIY